MSWKNKLENNKFSIKTGDGKTFKPLWKNGEKSKEFNYSKYDFINQEGSFIDRKKPQANSYPLVFWFDGDNNIEEAQRFEESASDSRPWTVNHPFYGVIKGQPTNLNRNDASYGLTEITVDFWQSIGDKYPEESDSIADNVREKVNSINTLSAANYAARAKPKAENIPDIKSNIEITAAKFNPSADFFNDFKQKINTALSNTDKLVTNPELAINSAQLIFSSPALFDRSIRDKIGSVKSAYNELKDLISGNQSKHYFESQAATLIGNFSESAVNPQEGDYIVKSEVEYVNSELTGLYNDYLETLDDIQVENEDIENAFIPSIELQQSLINLVTYTSQSLYILSFDARQERKYIVERDTNLIVLTHKFLGLDTADKNIETFKKINNIKLNEIYTIKKGRVISYYV